MLLDLEVAVLNLYRWLPRCAAFSTLFWPIKRREGRDGGSVKGVVTLVDCGTLSC